MGAYDDVYNGWKADPEGFWAEAARDIDWYKPFDKVLDDSNAPFTRWFPGGEMNTCHNCLDRHVAGGRADQLALIHDSPITGTVQKFTYKELLNRVAHFAGALQARGVEQGDRVIIPIPMTPEAAIPPLACPRNGPAPSVVVPGCAPHRLPSRIDDSPTHDLGTRALASETRRATATHAVSPATRYAA